MTPDDLFAARPGPDESAIMAAQMLKAIRDLDELPKPVPIPTPERPLAQRRVIEGGCANG